MSNSNLLTVIFDEMYDFVHFVPDDSRLIGYYSSSVKMYGIVSRACLLDERELSEAKNRELSELEHEAGQLLTHLTDTVDDLVLEGNLQYMIMYESFVSHDKFTSSTENDEIKPCSFEDSMIKIRLALMKYAKQIPEIDNLSYLEGLKDRFCGYVAAKYIMLDEETTENQIRLGAVSKTIETWNE